jgi:hypothetical protein
MIGLEPTRRKAPDPKSGMATNYITSATCRKNNVLLNLIKQKSGRKYLLFPATLKIKFVLKLFYLHLFSDAVLII